LASACRREHRSASIRSIHGGVGLVAFFFSAVLLGSVGSGVVQAQADPCAPSNFVDGDKNFDLAGYLACKAIAAGSGSVLPDTGSEGIVLPDTGSEGIVLPETGSEVGSIVGISGAFVILGGAVVYGSLHRRRSIAV